MPATIVWFRKDLRLNDNPAFYYAAERDAAIIPVYILDPQLGAAQRWWLHQSLQSLQTSLKKAGLQFVLCRGEPAKIIQDLIKETGAEAVFWNRNYDEESVARDSKIKADLLAKNIEAQSFKANLLIEPWELKPKQGDFFKVFTPFWKRCLEKSEFFHEPLELPATFKKFNQTISSDALEDWQLEPKKPDWAKGLRSSWRCGEAAAIEKLENFIENKLAYYEQGRDTPSEDSNSHLSPYLALGEISPLQIWHAIKQAITTKKISQEKAEVFLRQLCWREFSYNLLFNVKHFSKENFRPAFNHFPWLYSKKSLVAWRNAKTGYPIVDAGMRELWHTGIMHNRVRMIVASFLTKHLLIDWRKGAAWFWDTLVDADLANNSASWQWVAGSGADAAPYFRIFNPVLQGQKFDPEGVYVKYWLPELSNVEKKFIHCPWECPKPPENYPKPIVEHSIARERALKAYNRMSLPL